MKYHNIIIAHRVSCVRLFAWFLLPRAIASSGSLERSELGLEITSEVRRWLLGLTEGLQCSHAAWS